MLDTLRRFAIGPRPSLESVQETLRAFDQETAQLNRRWLDLRLEYDAWCMEHPHQASDRVDLRAAREHERRQDELTAAQRAFEIRAEQRAKHPAQVALWEYAEDARQGALRCCLRMKKAQASIDRDREEFIRRRNESMRLSAGDLSRVSDVLFLDSPRYNVADVEALLTEGK